MNPVTAQQRSATRMYADDCAGLECESQLRVAAAMLARTDEITATTVLGELRPDQPAQFESLVTDIADEYGLDATLRVEGGQFSVRFSVPTVRAAESAQSSRAPSWLLHRLPRWRKVA